MFHIIDIKHWRQHHHGQLRDWLHKVFHNKDLWSGVLIVAVVAAVFGLMLWLSQYIEPTESTLPYPRTYWLP